MNVSNPLLQQACLRDVADRRYRVLIIDFDHTLLLGNSTELFIDNTFPRGCAWFLANLGQKIARKLFRNNVLFNRWRDIFRVSFVLIGLPWSYWRWKANASKIGTQRSNEPLWAELKSRSDATVIIASLGFRQIITPLLPLEPKLRLIASSLAFPIVNLRHEGKVAAVQSLNASWADTLVVTDSPEDVDLINRATKGHQIEWGAEPLRPPAYFPLRYTAEGKYSLKNLVRHHLLIDLLVVSLAYFDGLSSMPLLLLLYFSLFTIYEIGYYENDFQASLREASPVVSPNAIKFQHYGIETAAWIWALGMLLVTGLCFSWQMALMWLGLLITLRAVYYVYNRLNPTYRVPLYIVLQGIKYFGYALVLVPSPVGICLLMAQAMRQCLSYLLYRISGTRRHPLPFHRIRLGLFLIMLVIGLILGGRNFLNNILSPLGGLIALWVAYQALKERFGGIGYRLRLLLGRTSDSTHTN